MKIDFDLVKSNLTKCPICFKNLKFRLYRDDVNDKEIFCERDKCHFIFNERLSSNNEYWFGIDIKWNGNDESLAWYNDNFANDNGSAVMDKFYKLCCKFKDKELALKLNRLLSTIILFE